MRNESLQIDFNNLRGDRQINQIVDEAENYIKFLEGQEDRLRKMEDALNEISEGKLANKEEFLAKFQEFKSA